MRAVLTEHAKGFRVKRIISIFVVLRKKNLCYILSIKIKLVNKSQINEDRGKVRKDC